MTFSIPNELFDKYREVCDYLIDHNNFGKACTIYYPPLKEECSNCETGLDGSTSTNVYRRGGPAPFGFGSCPLCGGNGYRETESTDSIRLRLYWSKKDWSKFGVKIPDADVMCIGYLSDLPKFKRANSISLISEQKHEDFRFVTACEPFPHGFGHNRYFICFLKRT